MPPFHDDPAASLTTTRRLSDAVPPVAQHQPPPVRTGGGAIQNMVIADIEARKQVGLERYGTLLQAHNGRDALMDAYQEALDLAVYLRQALEERDHPA